MTVVDIHSHLYPCIDDGSVSRKMTIEMLKEAERQGITTLFMTPHCWYIDGVSQREMKETIAELQKHTKVKLYLGCEIQCIPDLIDKIIYNLDAGLFPTMNGTKYVLVEFPTKGSYLDMRKSLKKLQMAGYKPIVAHCERYYRYIESTLKVKKLKEDGNLIQVNAFSLAGETNYAIHSLAMELLENNLIDFIGSDAHKTTHRNVAVEDGIEVVKRYSWADDILYRNAEKYLV